MELHPFCCVSDCLNVGRHMIRFFLGKGETEDRWYCENHRNEPDKTKSSTTPELFNLEEERKNYHRGIDV